MKRSRAFAMLGLGLTTALIVLLATSNGAESSPFRPWNGTWKGVFKVYHPDGRLSTRLNVTQTYTEINDRDQRAVFEEVDSNGKKTTAKARNWIEDGVLYCRVEKSDGSITTHTGRSLEGGGLCWSKISKEKTESFFERVVTVGEDTYYEIHGFGIYGAERNSFYFEGRYKKASP